MSFATAAGGLLLKQASKELIGYVQTGRVGVFGSLLRVVKTGEIVGYMQETTALAAIPFLANPATAPFAAATLISSSIRSLFDTQRTAKRIEKGVGRLEDGVGRVERGIGRIDNKLDKIDVLNSLGVANLAVSAAGVGI